MINDKILILVSDDEGVMKVKLDLLERKSKHNLDIVVLETGDKTMRYYLECKEKKRLPSIMFVDQNLKTTNYQGIDLVRKIFEIEHGVDSIPKIILSNTTGKMKYTPRINGDFYYPEYLNLTEIEAAKVAGASGWILKGGAEIINRIDYCIDKTLVEKNKEFIYIIDEVCTQY